MDRDKKKEAFNLAKIAYRCMDEENFHQAVEIFTKAIDLYPYDSMYYEYRAISYSKVGLYDKAEEDTLKALDLCPNSRLSYEIMAKCCIMTGKPKKAQEWLQDMNKPLVYFDELHALIKKYQEYLDLVNMGRFAEAYKKIDVILNIERSTHFELKKVFCLIHMEKLDDALQELNKFVFEDANSMDVCTIIHATGLIFYHKAHFIQASINLQQALELAEKPNYINSLTRLLNKVNEIEKLMFQAQMSSKEKKYLAALGYYNQALKIDPDNNLIKNILLFHRANTFMAMENFSSAITDLSIVVNYNTSNNIQATLLRTKCFEKLKEIENSQKNVLNELQQERRIAADFNKMHSSSKMERENGCDEKVAKRIHLDASDNRRQCGTEAAIYELSFIPKPSTTWLLSKTVNGRKTFLRESSFPDVKINKRVNEHNEEVYSINIFKTS